MPRKKGTPNKLTGEVKELLADIVHREQDSMKEALREVYTLDKFKYLQIICKLLVFVIPKAIEEHNISINEPINPPSWFGQSHPKSKEPSK